MRCDFGLPRRCLSLFLPLALVLTGTASAQIAMQGQSYYQASDCETCLPVHATVRVDYTISQDFGAGGELRVFLGYLSDGRTVLDPRRQDWDFFQVVDPEADSYCTTSTNSPLGTTVIQNHAAPFGFRVAPGDVLGNFQQGTNISLILGDTSADSPGYRVSPRPGGIRIIVQERRNAWSEWETAYPEWAYPWLEVGGTVADRFKVIIESIPHDADAIRMKVVAMQYRDGFAINSPVVKDYTGTIQFSSDSELVTLPSNYNFHASDEGVADFVLSAHAPHEFTVTVRDASEPGIKGTSNPVMVLEPESDLDDHKVYWGSMHVHTSVGGHGLGEPESAYDYARRVAGLDFFSTSEHSEGQISDGNFDWQALRAYGEDFTVPREFIAFSGYEWTSHSRGHRTVVFKNAETVPFIASSGTPTGDDVSIVSIDNLLQSLEGLDVITIPHHTAWNIATVDLGAVKDHPLQPLAEIYSWHGSSEYYDSPLPIHGSRLRMHPKGSGAFIQEALVSGYRFGFTGDADNHVGRGGTSIGQVHTNAFRYCRMGITGVYARRLSRNAIWEGLAERRTYATTGARILGWFWVDDHFIGDEFEASGDRTIRVKVRAGDVIDLVEILDGDQVIHTERPDSPAVDFTWTDTRRQPGRTHAYYVRIRQIGQLDPNQVDPHFAWLSPIWVTEKRPTDGTVPGQLDAR